MTCAWGMCMDMCMDMRMVYRLAAPQFSGTERTDTLPGVIYPESVCIGMCTDMRTDMRIDMRIIVRDICR